jgi:hypothetical protein
LQGCCIVYAIIIVSLCGTSSLIFVATLVALRVREVRSKNITQISVCQPGVWHLQYRTIRSNNSAQQVWWSHCEGISRRRRLAAAQRYRYFVYILSVITVISITYVIIIYYWLSVVLFFYFFYLGARILLFILCLCILYDEYYNIYCEHDGAYKLISLFVTILVTHSLYDNLLYNLGFISLPS